MEHPVGTGPFKLVAWKRSSKMVFDRNPNYRQPEYDYAAPAGADARRVAVAAAFKGGTQMAMGALPATAPPASTRGDVHDPPASRGPASDT